MSAATDVHEVEGEEVEEINGRLQRCLITPSLSSADSKRSFTDPDTFLSEVYESLKVSKPTLCVCFRKDECKCKSTDECLCDSDECMDVSEVKFASHSNCRYTVELILNGQIAAPAAGVILRLFCLDAQKVETPVLDIASLSWSTISPSKQRPKPKNDTSKPKNDTSKPKNDTSKPKNDTSKPKKDTSKPQKNISDDEPTFGSVLVYSQEHNSSLTGLQFQLLESVRLEQRAVLLSFDYMSFAPFPR